MYMRLQKFLARSGIASRRASEELISGGHVSVNGVAVTRMGVNVDADNDVIAVDGVRVRLVEDNVTLMLHKPAGYICTANDPQMRPTVYELIPKDEFPSLYCIGRLDVDTTGLLLFSTDGELGAKLLHPRNHVLKSYFAYVEGVCDKEDVEQLRSGVMLDDGMTLPAEVDVLSDEAASYAASRIGEGADSSGYMQRQRLRYREGAGEYVSIGIREGRNRQIRRMFDAIGHHVISLHRETFGSVQLGDLKRASWRLLSDEERGLL